MRLMAPATTVLKTVLERRPAQPFGDREGCDERHGERHERHDQAVETPLERGGRVAKRPRLAGQPLGIAVRSDRGDLETTGALDRERAGEHLVAG